MQGRCGEGGAHRVHRRHWRPRRLAGNALLHGGSVPLARV
uniref:Uncharacterized protein n=1 Tax=Arundo donax TaxID=35708 RepID=A0A0A9DKV1_ARUDO